MVTKFRQFKKLKCPNFVNCPNFVPIFCCVLKIRIIFFTSLAVLRPSRSGIHWPINFSKKIDKSVYFQQKQKKVQNWREEKGHFSFVNCPNFVTIFCQDLKMERKKKFISLAIPRPSRSLINWPINFSKKKWHFCLFSKKKIGQV